MSKTTTLARDLTDRELKKHNIPRAKSTMVVASERISERELERIAPKTGYEKLDEYIKGWIPGHLYVLSGETNIGKTATACNFAVRVAQQDKKVTYFALEPDATVIEYIAGIYHNKRWDQITDDDVLVDIPGIGIYTKESHGTLDELLFTIEHSERQDLIVVDHIGYFTSNPGDRRSATEQQSDALKRIVSAAKAKKTAVMIIAHPRKPQTTRKNKILGINDISGSAAFKQDATDVLMLHRFAAESNSEYENKLSNRGFIALLKVKAGKSGETVPIRFIEESPIMLEDEAAGLVELQGLGID